MIKDIQSALKCLACLIIESDVLYLKMIHSLMTSETNKGLYDGKETPITCY